MGQFQSGPIDKPSRGARCPVCSAPANPATRPFCSVRCADVDLIRWLGGRYAIPGQQDADEDGDDSQAAQRPGESGGEEE